MGPEDRQQDEVVNDEPQRCRGCYHARIDHEDGVGCTVDGCSCRSYTPR